MPKKYPNTSKSRKKIPAKPGAYNLKNRNEKTVYTGHSKNVRRRINEHNKNKNLHFSYITVTLTKTKSKAHQIESNRLENEKPPKNKKKA